MRNYVYLYLFTCNYKYKHFHSVSLTFLSHLPFPCHWGSSNIRSIGLEKFEHTITVIVELPGKAIYKPVLSLLTPSLLLPNFSIIVPAYQKAHAYLNFHKYLPQRIKSPHQTNPQSILKLRVHDRSPLAHACKVFNV